MFCYTNEMYLLSDIESRARGILAAISHDYRMGVFSDLKSYHLDF